jgi:hypothetical protein
MKSTKKVKNTKKRLKSRFLGFCATISGPLRNLFLGVIFGFSQAQIMGKTGKKGCF